MGTFATYRGTTSKITQIRSSFAGLVFKFQLGTVDSH